MNKGPKILIGLFASTTVVVVVLFAYWNRNQRIDLAAYMPSDYKYCGKNIGRSNREYMELQQWFEANKNDWKNTLATYVPKVYFSSSVMSVNVWPTQVMVNYQTKDGEWAQVFKRKPKSALEGFSCGKANK